MNAVIQINISMPRRPENHLRPRRHPARRMRGQIVAPQVSLGLDDRPRSFTMHQQLSEQPPRHLHRRSLIECAWENSIHCHHYAFVHRPRSSARCPCQHVRKPDRGTEAPGPLSAGARSRTSTSRPNSSANGRNPRLDELKNKLSLSQPSPLHIHVEGPRVSSPTRARRACFSPASHPRPNSPSWLPITDSGSRRSSASPRKTVHTRRI